jgi:hypothetical protein
MGVVTHIRDAAAQQQSDLRKTKSSMNPACKKGGCTAQKAVHELRARLD